METGHGLGTHNVLSERLRMGGVDRLRRDVEGVARATTKALSVVGDSAHLILITGKAVWMLVTAQLASRQMHRLSPACSRNRNHMQIYYVD